MQMNKKLLIGICTGIILVLLAVFVFNKNKKVKNETNDLSEIRLNDGVLFDEETGLYYLKNNETGEIIYASRHEEELQVYIDNPDYNPNPLAPKRTTLEDYMYIEEYNENPYEESIIE